MRLMRSLIATLPLLWSGVLLAAPTTAPTTSPTAIHAAYERASQDLLHGFWDSSARPPHIRPTHGGDSSPTAHDNGLIDANPNAKPSVWEMCQYANVLYWDWKITHAPAAKARFTSQWNYLRTKYSEADIASCKKSVGIANVSDDAAWTINYLCQVHEMVGDAHALQDAMTLIANTLDRFADPNAPRVDYGSLKGSPYGILYATPTDDPNHQGCSSAYEIMIANVALYIYQQNHNADYLQYAAGTYDWMHQYMKHPTRGYYFCELDIRPTRNGQPNKHYLKPNGDNWGPPQRGLASSYSGGTMAMAVCAARLYAVTHDRKYLDEARTITSDYLKPHSFLRPGNLFVNERDAWTDGYWSPFFAAEVVSLPDDDPNGLWKAACLNTAASIAAQRTPDGHYGADWSGPELNTHDKSTNWIEQAARSGGMATPQQIMTSANSVSMIQAAEVLSAAR